MPRGLADLNLSDAAQSASFQAQALLALPFRNPWFEFRSELSELANE